MNPKKLTLSLVAFSLVAFLAGGIYLWRTGSNSTSNAPTPFDHSNKSSSSKNPELLQPHVKDTTPTPFANVPPPSIPSTENPDPAAPPVSVTTGFDCSYPYPIKRITSSYFAIDFQNKPANFFLLKVENAKGRTIRFDLRNTPLNKWATFNPVYTYETDINALSTYTPSKLGKSNATVAKNGAKLPDTSDQKWHYIPEVWTEGKTLAFSHTFTQPTAYIAMRIPYTPAYNEAYLQHLAKSYPDLLKLHNLGNSAEGRPLFLVEIAGSTDAKRQNPGIVIYAREHATEHDTSWVAQGMLEYILSENTLRNAHSFLIIPLLDPDGATAGKQANIIESFVAGRETPESKAYGTFFRKWVDAGNRLDFVHNLHNVESQEAQHLSCAMIEPKSGRQKACLAFHNQVLSKFRDSGYRVWYKPWYETYLNFRLGGYLQRYYGPLHIPYEVNSQERTSHLALHDLHTLGEKLLEATAKFHTSPDGQSTMAAINEKRKTRDTLWKDYADILTKNPYFDNALDMEQTATMMPWLAEERKKTQNKKQIQ